MLLQECSKLPTGNFKLSKTKIPCVKKRIQRHLKMALRAAYRLLLKD